jgi:hypothetical protein
MSWENVKARARKLSDHVLKSPIQDIRDIQFGDVSNPITMNLDGNSLVYENQMWRLGKNK